MASESEGSKVVSMCVFQDPFELQESGESSLLRDEEEEGDCDDDDKLGLPLSFSRMDDEPGWIPTRLIVVPPLARLTRLRQRTYSYPLV